MGTLVGKKYDKYKTKAGDGKLQEPSGWADKLAEELHKPIRRRFIKRKVFSKGSNHIRAADLVDMKQFAEENEGTKFLLAVIDVFSKFGWIEPLKTKKGESVALALESIFSKGRKPKFLWTDKGTKILEFSSYNLVEKIK